MPRFEVPSICTLDEYESERTDALLGSEMEVDEVYVLLMALRYPYDLQAVKIPTRLTEKTPTSNGYELGLSVLDADLQETAHFAGKMIGKEFVTLRPMHTTYRENLDDEAYKVRNLGFFKGFNIAFDFGIMPEFTADEMVNVG